ncbi:hypothetical protein ES703_107408 [subsurface metagenome]
MQKPVSITSQISRPLKISRTDGLVPEEIVGSEVSRLALSGGSLYIINDTIPIIIPITPIITNPYRQLKARAKVGIVVAVIIPPKLRAVCLNPIAVALSFNGNHTNTALVVEGIRQPIPNPARYINISPCVNVVMVNIPVMKMPPINSPISSIRRTPILSTSQPAGINIVA